MKQILKQIFHNVLTRNIVFGWQKISIPGVRAFQQIVGVPIGINRAPLLADEFLYSYEFIPGLLKKNETKLARFFNFTFHYIYMQMISYH